MEKTAVSTIDHRVRRHLETLPEPALPDALQQRLQQSLHRRRRRLRLAIAGGAAAVVAVAIFPLLPPWQEPPTPAPMTHVPPVEPGNTRMSQLHALDRALQAAYDRGASDDEIAPLWEARRALTASAAAPAPAMPAFPARSRS